MADIFISYAREDRRTARMIAEKLEAMGLDVFWDREIPIGKTFDEVIEAELEAARCVVVLWSENAVCSSWVKVEAGEAAARQSLIPAFIEDVRPPLEFRRIQTADLIGWDGTQDSEGFQNLLRSIRDLAGEQGETPIGTEVETPAPEPAETPEPPDEARPGPGWLANRKLIAAVAVAIIATLGLWLWLGRGPEATDPAEGPDPTPTQPEPADEEVLPPEEETQPADEEADSSISGLSPETSADEIGRRLGPAVVALASRGGSAHCSGFLVDPVHVLTADYCKSGDGPVEIVTDRNRRYPARWLGSDEAIGVGVLEVETDGLPYLPMADREPRVDDVLVLLGGIGREVIQGTVAKVDAEDLEVLRPADDGRGTGGGPLVDDRGRVVAVERMAGPTGDGSTRAIARRVSAIEEYAASLGAGPQGNVRAKFVSSVQAFADRVGLPPVDIGFSPEVARDGVILMWNREKSRVEINPKHLDDPQTAVLAALSGYFYRKYLDECSSSGAMTTGLYNEIHNGLVAYLAASEQASGAEARPVHWKLHKLFDDLERAVPERKRQVRSLAYELFKSFDCSWQREELPDQIQRINGQLDLLPQSALDAVFRRHWQF